MNGISKRTPPSLWSIFFFVLQLIFSLSLQPSALAQEHDHDHMDHSTMSMPMDGAPDPTQPANRLAWKRESEFNHHLAGFFVLIAGIFILAEAWMKKPVPTLHYLWPACFLASGLFVLVYSDTELWPFGYKPWFQGVISNPEVIQHKVFSILLLGLGFIELARARGRLTALWSAWVFPVVAVTGSVMLLFHSHGGHMMHTPDHMAVMERIKSEHLSYSLAGFGIGLSKGLAEVPNRWQTIFAKVWPSLMIALGILLMFYKE